MCTHASAFNVQLPLPAKPSIDDYSSDWSDDDDEGIVQSGGAVVCKNFCFRDTPLVYEAVLETVE